MSETDVLIIRELGVQPYEPIWRMMQNFTNNRTQTTQDEVWLLQHERVFTQGQAGEAEHLLMPGDIPVVYSDRGGQITYHGPGQLICYLLIDIKRHHLGVRALVSAIENMIIDLLASYNISAYAKADAPGVYVDGAKIASLGLRVRRHSSFHGFALNAQMDLEPFSRINPCGYQGLKMSQLSDFIGDVDFMELTTRMIKYILANLGYTQVSLLSEKNTELL